MDEAEQIQKNLTLNTKKAFELITLFDPEKSKWTDSIEKPRGGDVIIFYTMDHGKVMDWKSDGYRWINDGKKLRNKNTENEIYKTYYKLFLGNKQHSTEFVKHVYEVPGIESPVVVEYIGYL
jgi:hypothetical protein